MSNIQTPIKRLSVSGSQFFDYVLSRGPNLDDHVIKCENARKRLLENSEKSKNEKHIRLKPLQKMQLSVLEKSEYYTKWVSENDYLVFQDQDGRIFSVIASKRGNDVYTKKIDEKFKNLKNSKLASGISLYGNVQETTTDILFITLTESSRKNSVDEAWKSIGKKYNRFRSAIIKKYGKVEFLRSFESHESGYPHIHVLIKFLDHRFDVFKYTDAEGKKMWLVKKNQKIKECWKYGYSKIKGCTSVKEGLAYVGKYVLKSAVGNPEKNLTLAMNWYYGKRAFSVSKKFFLDLIKEMCNSNHISNSNYTFLGVFPSFFVRSFVLNRDAFDRGKWKNILSNKVLDAIRDREISKLEEDFQKSIPKRIVLKEFFDYSRVHQEMICVDTIEFDNFKDYGDDIELRPTNLLKIDYSVEEKIIEEMQLQEYFSRRSKL